MPDKRSSMKIYTSTGTIKTIEECNLRGIGLMMVADWRDPDRWPYFAVDNGCYSAYSRGVEWDPKPFFRHLERCLDRGYKPDFIVLPDKVASKDSLEFSGKWHPVLTTKYPAFPVYLPVQDGMELEDVERFYSTHMIDGIFIGGSMAWKLETMKTWATWAHDRGLKCHVGRIGPVRCMIMAELAGADSIDSTTWVQRRGALSRYMDAFEQQTTLNHF